MKELATTHLLCLPFLGCISEELSSSSDKTAGHHNLIGDSKAIVVHK